MSRYKARRCLEKDQKGFIIFLIFRFWDDLRKEVRKSGVIQDICRYFQIKYHKRVEPQVVDEFVEELMPAA